MLSVYDKPFKKVGIMYIDDAIHSSSCILKENRIWHRYAKKFLRPPDIYDFGVHELTIKAKDYDKFKDVYYQEMMNYLIHTYKDEYVDIVKLITGQLNDFFAQVDGRKEELDE